MNEEQFKTEIRERWGRFEKRRHHGRVWTGLLLLGIGALWLIRSMNPDMFPVWFFTWPVFLIAIGLISGIRHGFRGGFWAVMLLIGGLFLADRIDPTLHMDHYVWPIVFICLGLVFILNPRKKNWRRYMKNSNDHEYSNPSTGSTTIVGAGVSAHTSTSSDVIDVTAVFGGTKKIVISKNFKGGDITAVMGGAEIDLSQADFSGTVKIDATCVFGGTKLIIPPTWDLQNDITAIFGGVEDKRNITGVSIDHNKVLILEGTCMFGGIDIRSY